MAHSKNLHVSTLISASTVTLALAGLIALVAVRVDRAYTQDLQVERGWKTTPADAVAARASQLERLSRYGWIDRAKSVTSIPIERAMALVVEESAQERRETPR